MTGVFEPFTYPLAFFIQLRKLKYMFRETFKVSTVQFKVSKKHKGYFNAFIVLDNPQLLMIAFEHCIKIY